jgi:hypothetical protein
VSTPVSFATVVAVAMALAALALHDGSEFLFCAAVAGTLSAPFVTLDRVTSPDALLAFGAIVLLGGLYAVRDPRWERAFVVLVGGALAYALTATGLPVAAGWHSPFAVSAFGGACALGALLLAHESWRSGLVPIYLQTESFRL